MHDLYLLDLPIPYGDRGQHLSPVILRDGNETILVDCGYPQSATLLETAAADHGIALSSLTRLILTHHDMDHIGSAAELKRAYPHVQILAHEAEAPYIAGEAKSLRLAQAEDAYDALPEEAREAASGFIAFLGAIEPVRVDHKLASGEKLPWCGGIEVVHTPGHMPGHISLYVPASRTMIAADAVVIEQGALAIANPQYTLDLKEAVRSVRRMLDYEIDELICYHGGRYSGHVRAALLQLLRACE
ncbi:MBL fold metallo-hydrolase [Paenibacillus methanolicus]|uniref:Glyoxylase-like metal-dependent hydrolase (Beta-lactamase superfamily II) n=1 Tax=Paenibacillus methanolicus TaxID=582686 RepID=A0A5S5C5L2_9BACL|nr:MBL fold metallo-hydrolase [Paenibacillus methanolicus]TYP74624.1 glyoxylase-like metal-dependent hydrolase (beta-lactamase superfamily II) [Paenibacillus methanolicus]